MTENVYAAPSAPLENISSGGTDCVTTIAVGYLRSTKPWVRFLSIMSFLFSTMMLFSGVSILIGGLMGGGQEPEIMGLLTGIGMFYLLFGILQYIPSFLMFRYASAITQLVRSGKIADMELALVRQKNIWVFVGILAILMLLMVIAMIVGGVYFGNSLAFR